MSGKQAKAPRLSAAAQDRAEILAALAALDAKLDALRADVQVVLAAAINAERAASQE